MATALIVILILFVLGYTAIALEHPLHLDKAASALFLGVACWTIYAMNVDTLLTDEMIPDWFVTAHHEHGGGHGDDGDVMEDATSTAATEPGADAKHDHETEGHESAHATEHTAIAEMPDAERIELKRAYMIEGQLLLKIGEISEILFFLLGAMTIVEIVDAHEGFKIITDRIDARSKVKLLWMTSWLAFFMSAVLDNLTSTIVMVSLVKKLIKDDSRLLYVGMVVVAANAGGAWTVIGDVTTTMLWIGGKLSVVGVMKALIVPSIVCLVIPLLIVSMGLKGQTFAPKDPDEEVEQAILAPFYQKLFLGCGLFGLLCVPVFKIVTHLPPFVGMLGALSLMWLLSDSMRRGFEEKIKSTTHVIEILRRVDTASILFFLGILLAVECLASTGVLMQLAASLDEKVGNLQVVAVITGLVSAIVDNVPLVAAAKEMYSFPTDDTFWHLLAFTAGTGGSCLIIGSAAGVAAMGLDKITFGYYLKKIAPLALVGYFAGIACYLGQIMVFGV